MRQSRPLPCQTLSPPWIHPGLKVCNKVGSFSYGLSLAQQLVPLSNLSLSEGGRDSSFMTPRTGVLEGNPKTSMGAS